MSLTSVDGTTTAALQGNADGTMGSYKASTAAIHDAIGKGQKKREYSGIRVPVLALFEFPRVGGSPGYQPKTAALRTDDVVMSTRFLCPGENIRSRPAGLAYDQAIAALNGANPR